jgi:hypothetical protein
MKTRSLHTGRSSLSFVIDLIVNSMFIMVPNELYIYQALPGNVPNRQINFPTPR